MHVNKRLYESLYVHHTKRMCIFRRLGLNQSKLDIMIALKKMDGQKNLKNVIVKRLEPGKGAI